MTKTISGNFSSRTKAGIPPERKPEVKSGRMNSISRRVELKQKTASETGIKRALKKIDLQENVIRQLEMKLSEIKTEFARSGKLIDTLFHSADVGIVILDSKGTMVKVNNGLCKLLGFSEGELLGRSYFQVVVPAERRGFKIARRKIVSGHLRSYEVKIVRKEGSCIDCFVNSNIFSDDLGNKFIVKTIRDISESKRYKDLLHEAEMVVKMGGYEYDVLSDKLTWTREMYRIYEKDFHFIPTIDSVIKMYEKESRKVLKGLVADSIRYGKNFDVELELLTSGNNKKWVRATCNAIRNRSKVVKLIGTVQDISERKKVEFELEQLSWVASHTSNAVIISDYNGHVEWANSSFENLTGYKLSEIKGRFPEEIIRGAHVDKETLRRISEKLLKKRQSTGEVLLYYTKQGKPIWVTSDITPIFKSGKLINYIGIMTDITDLIEAKEMQRDKESLIRSEQLLNAIAKNFPGGIIGVLDKDLNCIFKGGSELDDLGYNGQNFAGYKLFNYLASESGVNAGSYVERAFKGESSSFDLRIKKNIYSVTVVPLHRKNDIVLQVLAVIQNITERKKAEEETLRALQQQKDLNELKSKFVSIASHEFRTPLTTILSSVFLISQYNKPGDEERRAKHLAKIKDAVSNLTDILNDFLSLGKIEDGGLTNNPVIFNPVDFCVDLLNELSPSLKEGQRIVFDHHGIQDVIYTDIKHLKHVLTNLISNAIKYSTERTSIILEITSGRDEINFSVKDQGIGIPDDDQVHLFETFFRAKNAVNIQGTGMGLHIVKKCLDLMGGRISFTSKMGEGSTFTAIIPDARIARQG